MNKLITALLALFITSCAHKKTADHSTPQLEKSDSKKEDLKLPAIPMAIVEPVERASFLAGHYWDNLDLKSIENESDTIRLEQYFSNYLAILNESNKSKLKDNISKSLVLIQSDSIYLSMFNYLAGKYLYDPNSPFRDEEVYSIFVNEFMNNPKLSFADKERLHFKNSLLQKNRIGHKAENFSFKTDKGISSLSEIKADLLLLYFNNPGCHACEEVQRQLQSSDMIKDQIQRGGLVVLSVYPDEDLSEWEKHKAQQPQSWINAYDSKQEIKSGLLYDLKAIPTIYLLDQNKNVLLKDVTVQQVESYIYEYK